MQQSRGRASKVLQEKLYHGQALEKCLDWGLCSAINDISNKAKLQEDGTHDLVQSTEGLCEIGQKHTIYSVT